jgi:Domain of unknown function (DUF3598)
VYFELCETQIVLATLTLRKKGVAEIQPYFWCTSGEFHGFPIQLLAGASAPVVSFSVKITRMFGRHSPCSMMSLVTLAVASSCAMMSSCLSVEGLAHHHPNPLPPQSPRRALVLQPESAVLMWSSRSALDDPTPEEDAAIQWELFNKHHARGSWRGIWTTYDYMGDVMDETVASVDLNPLNGREAVEHTHTIVVGATRSDCATCFDSTEQKVLPVALCTPDNILHRRRLAGVSMVNGPSLLRSGSMATELVLRHGDGRVRATFHHAPVWERGVDPGSCPPQGLKLFRVMLSREALRPTAPTAETEASEPPKDGNPVFYRPVPPFNWHKKWGGTSWTWGAQTGNRGWSVDEIDETDSWHGITPVDCWNLRLGGVHLQAPRVITDAAVAICRLAWLPDDQKLLRVEAGVSALQPMLVDDSTMVGFEPPALTSLRCDMLQKVGELDNISRVLREKKGEERDMHTLNLTDSDDRMV